MDKPISNKSLNKDSITNDPTIQPQQPAQITATNIATSLSAERSLLLPTPSSPLSLLLRNASDSKSVNEPSCSSFDATSDQPVQMEDRNVTNTSMSDLSSSSDSMNEAPYDVVIITGPKNHTDLKELKKIANGDKSVLIIGSGQSKITQENLDEIKSKIKATTIIIVEAHGFVKKGIHYLNIGCEQSISTDDDNEKDGSSEDKSSNEEKDNKLQTQGMSYGSRNTLTSTNNNTSSSQNQSFPMNPANIHNTSQEEQYALCQSISNRKSIQNNQSKELQSQFEKSEENQKVEIASDSDPASDESDEKNESSESKGLIPTVEFIRVFNEIDLYPDNTKNTTVSTAIRNTDQSNIHSADSTSKWQGLCYVFSCKIGQALEKIPPEDMKYNLIMIGDEHDSLTGNGFTVIKDVIENHTSIEEVDPVKAFCIQAMSTPYQVSLVNSTQKLKIDSLKLPEKEEIASLCQLRKTQLLAVNQSIKPYQGIIEAMEQNNEDLQQKQLWFDSAARNDIATLEKLFALNSQILFACDADSMNGLMHAAESGKQEAVGWMIKKLKLKLTLEQKKQFLEQRNHQGWTVLMLASCPDNDVKSNTSKEICGLLIDEGADLHSKLLTTGETALMLVQQQEDRGEVIELLIGKGAGINARDNNGNTPLLHALLYALRKSKQSKTNLDDANILTLLESGAHVAVQNNEGQTPLLLAEECGDETIIRHLKRFNKPTNTNANDTAIEGMKIDTETSANDTSSTRSTGSQKRTFNKSGDDEESEQKAKRQKNTHNSDVNNSTDKKHDASKNQ